MQVIHMLGPRIDQQSLQTGLQQETLDLEETAVVYSPDAVSGEELRSPRSHVKFRDINGDTQEIAVRDLDERVQRMLGIAQGMPDPWQLYQDPDGVIRVVVSNEVLQAYKSRYQ